MLSLVLAPGASTTVSGGALHPFNNIFVGIGVGTSAASVALASGSIATSETLVGDSGPGIVNQSGGFWSTTNTEFIGDGSFGAVNLAGGTHLVLNTLYIGADATGVGAYSISNGATLTIGNTLRIGVFGPSGVFSQTGGSTTISSGITIGGLSGTGGANTGTLNLSGGTFQLTNSTALELVQIGTINQSGGTHTTPRLTLAAGSAYNLSGGSAAIASTLSVGGTLNMTGGALSAGLTINSGLIAQSAGASSLGPVSGTGQITLGATSGATASMNAKSISQSSLTIKSTGSLTLSPATARASNSISTLTLTGAATFDLANHELLTNSSPATIKSYLAQSFDPAGNADWQQPGLTSSVARANPIKYSLAYAYGGDTSAEDAAVTTHDDAPLAPTQTIARAVLTGDANMDGHVDFFDITQLLAYKYNTAQPASYTDGDLNYDGVVNFFDITTLLSANYNSGETYTGAPFGAAAAAPSEVVVPEPASLTAMGLGLLPLLARRSRRRGARRTWDPLTN
jgi:hypothetical protein